MNTRTLLYCSLTASWTMLLAACGGGGGGGGSNSGAGPAPANPLSDNAALASLSIAEADLDQIFQPTQSDYTAEVRFLTPTVTLGARPDDTAATVRVNGAAVGVAGIDEPLLEGDNVFAVAVTAEDGVTQQVYHVAVRRQTAAEFAQQAYVKAANAGAGDAFGMSIALDGDTLAVGAPYEDSGKTGVGAVGADDGAMDAGAVYLFARDSGGNWAPGAYLKPSNTGPGDSFGASVALDGDTLVVGAPYEDSAETGAAGDGTDDSAPDAGAVYVFTRDSAGMWSQRAYLKASNTDPGDDFGIAVALDGDTLVVGASREDSIESGTAGHGSDNNAIDAGAAYVFARDATGAWSQVAYLKASNTDSGDNFGYSVAVAENTLVVGARYESSASTAIDAGQANNDAQSAGAAYVFVRDGAGAWSQQAYLKPSNTDASDAFGTQVALSRDTVAVGAVFERSSATGVDGDDTDNTASEAGAVYVFVRDDTGTWSQQAYIKASNAARLDHFGASLALSGDLLAVGATGESSSATGINGAQADDSMSESGAVYVLSRSGSVWSQQAYVKASNTGTLEAFGYAVAISGDTVAVGAANEDSAATTVDGDQSDNTAAGAGAVYVLR